MRLRCLLSTVWETLSMGAFWRSLLHPPLVVADGHVWPRPAEWEWSYPEPGEDGWIERDRSRCVRCGKRSDGWRRWWGMP